MDEMQRNDFILVNFVPEYSVTPKSVYYVGQNNALGKEVIYFLSKSKAQYIFLQKLKMEKKFMQTNIVFKLLTSIAGPSTSTQS